MLETDSTPDRWINFVLQNGWRLNARVNEETGDLSVSVSNESGESFKQDVWENLSPKEKTPDNIRLHSLEEHKQNFKLIPNEEESN